MERVLTSAHMKPLHWLALASAMTACAGADGSSETEASGAIGVVVAPLSPTARGSNTFSLDVGEHGPASSVEVSAWMPAMGHGSPGAPRVVQESTSRYRIEDVTFSMPGTWELRVRVTCAMGIGQRTFRYDVP